MPDPRPTRQLIIDEDRYVAALAELAAKLLQAD
jgi:hypothetical protein